MDLLPGLRYGGGTAPNINFTVPRKADVAWLAAAGYRKGRLPFMWEMLQPMLHDTPANAFARDAIGQPGAFHPGYEAYITGILDEFAARGMKCVLDLHNYCRYRDFVFQSDGSVIGLVKPSNPLVRAYTTNSSQVRTRIFALAPGATLTKANFNDFWTRAAMKWKAHPGFGGYGLMNEPYNMPDPGQIEESDGYNQDLTIWPSYAQSVINAIRAVDPTNPIYLGGNHWSNAMDTPFVNPGWPLQGSNIIYEVHLYLDAGNTGQGFDWDTEAARPYNAGLTPPMTEDTGWKRLQISVEWAKANNLTLALLETGMPIDDPRWQESYQRMCNYARQNNVEVFSWNGGSHWTYRNAGINHVPGWHQNKTLEPAQSGPMKAAFSIPNATLFDDGPGWAPSGSSVTITVYARGYLASPVTVTVSSNNGGVLSKSQLTIPAGANTQDTFTFTPGLNRVTTLTYSVSAAGLTAPPPRKVFSLTDPVAYAATSLPDAAMAILAKYSACKWELAHGYTDHLQGGPAGDGQVVRAISDSGYGSSVGNAMEMINWINTDGNMGTMVPPVMRVTNGRKYSDHTAYDTTGFWCRKSLSVPLIQPNPRNRVPYAIEENHFAISAVSVPGLSNSGVLFQASHHDGVHCSQLSFANSQPQAKWLDNAGKEVLLTSPTRLVTNAPSVVSLTSTPGAQRLRVNRAVVASAAQTFNPSPFNQMLIGWAYQSYFPRDFFNGHVYSVIAGKGAISVSELDVLERYLGTTAGI